MKKTLCLLGILALTGCGSSDPAAASACVTEAQLTTVTINASGDKMWRCWPRGSNHSTTASVGYVLASDKSACLVTLDSGGTATASSCTMTWAQSACDAVQLTAASGSTFSLSTITNLVPSVSMDADQTGSSSTSVVAAECLAVDI